MEKYKIKTAFKNFSVNQVVSRSEVIQSLNVPIPESGTEVLFALIMADILELMLPTSLEREVFISKEACDCGNTDCVIATTFTSKYSLIDAHTTSYASEIEGLPLAFLDELLEMGYNANYTNENGGKPYIELEGDRRFYAGDTVYQLLSNSDKSHSISPVILSDDFFEKGKVGGEYFFSTENDAYNYFLEMTKEKKDPLPDFNIPVDEKKFSVTDIKKMIAESKTNNGSLFARNFADDIIEKALMQII